MEFDLYSNHILNSSEETLGFDAENQSENITINIKDLNLIDKWAYLEFETDEKHKYITARLDIVDNKIVYTLPNGLLKYGYVKFQVVFRYNNNWSWKSNEKSVFVRHSINASTGYPEEYPDFIGEAQEVLNKTEEALEQIEGFEQGILERVDTVEQKVETFEQEMLDFEQAEAQRVVNEGVRQTNEQTRQTNELERVQNENERKQNEIARQQAESQRQTTFEANEQTRQATFNSNEQARQQVFEQKEGQREENELQRQANETLRTQNETQRTQNENSRVSAENARIIAENNRVSQEETRQTQESSRVNAESLRVSAENTRASNESTRQSNESTRQDNESTRVSNEATREQNESTRIANEEARVQAENDRATEFATWESEIDAKADKDYVDKKDTNLQYEIADLKAKLYETVVGVKQLETTYASEIDIPTHITEDSVAYPVLDNTAIEAATIKGHTLKWNQLLQNGDFKTSGIGWAPYYYGGSTSWSNGIYTVSKSNGTCDISQPLSQTIPSGHKVIFISKLKTTNNNNVGFGGTSFSGTSFATTTSFNSYYYIHSLTSDLARIYVVCYGTENVEINIDYVYLIDLTQLFGSGNEPTTLDDNKTKWAINYAIKNPDYNIGSLKNVNVEKIESYTFNLLDNTTFVKGRVDNGIVGYAEGTSSLIITETGVTFTTTGGFRGVASGLVKINSNNNICINTIGLSGASCNLFVDYYDKDENWIGRVGGAIATQVTISTPPSNAYYVRISYQLTNAGKITLSEININYSNNSINGKYTPSKKLGSLTLPNIDLRGVNNIQDDLTFVEQENGTYNLEHTKYVDRVDMGTLDWSLTGAYFFARISDLKNEGYNTKLLCSKYTTAYNQTQFVDKTISGVQVAYVDNVVARDSNYTTVGAFKTANSGVPLDYQLANPIKTVIATGLLFDEVSLLINKYGRIEVVNRSTDNVNADTTFNVAVKEFKDNE